MSNDTAGRTPRSTSGGAPMGSTVAIVVTAVAVVLGFLILRNVNDSDDTTGAPTATSTSTTLAGTATTLPITTTTQPALVTTGTKVQVANASNASGVAKQMTTALAGEGFETAEPTNSTLNPKLEVTKVIYDPNDPNAQPVAASVALTLGGVAVEASTAAPPVESGAFADGSGVIVLLGNDLAGKTIAEISGEATTGTTTPPTTAAPVTAVPTTTA